MTAAELSQLVDSCGADLYRYFISYGSDKVEVQKMAFAVWVQDGVQYTLCANDNRPSDQMFSMAEQIIAAP